MSFWDRFTAWMYTTWGKGEPIPFWEDLIRSNNPDYKPESGWGEDAHSDRAAVHGSGWNVTTEYHAPKKPRKPKATQASQEEKWAAVDKAQAAPAKQQKPKKKKPAERLFVNMQMEGCTFPSITGSKAGKTTPAKPKQATLMSVAEIRKELDMKPKKKGK